MHGVIVSPPLSPIEPVTDILHGVAVTDPYRWLEDPGSERTRAWLEEQARYARSYLDTLPGRERIRQRIREFLAVDTYDSVKKSGEIYFFRKRLADQEQPCIYMRRGLEGPEELLIDPTTRGEGKYTAVRPLILSRNARFLLYEVKHGGERTGTFEIIDTQTRRVLDDVLPRGYLRGFAFAPDEASFYYVHEEWGSSEVHASTVRRHIFGSALTDDTVVFSPGPSDQFRMSLMADRDRLGCIVSRYTGRKTTSLYLARFDSLPTPDCVVPEGEFILGPKFIGAKILAITDLDAPNFRIVELRLKENAPAEWLDIVPETESRIHQWIVSRDRILVSYVRPGAVRVSVLDLRGGKQPDWPLRTGGRTVRLIAASAESNDIVIETESFTRPPALLVCRVTDNRFDLWTERHTPFKSDKYSHSRLSYASRDGTRIPMYLVGGRRALKEGSHPVVMTSYGGYGVSMTPQFSIFVAYMLERGCLFALPFIRGGGEFGAEWHARAKRERRQTAFDDFLAAAEFLISTGRTTPEKFAIFGGSNSGLLVAAAATQRPDLFRAVVCMVPLVDMLRYHLFDNAHVWADEYGTADDAGDFAALVRYSPYHQVREGVAYPATLIVSGDRDQNCNPLHARKLTARLQANSSRGPILLDYNPERGHSPVLPLSDRVEALTDRMAFLADQLGLSV